MSFFRNCGQTGKVVSAGQPFLFHDNELKDILRNKQQNIPIQVYSISQDQFLTTIYDCLIKYFVFENTIEPLVIYEDRIVVSEPRECRIEISGDGDMSGLNRDEPYYIGGYEVKIELPFKGCWYLWYNKTSVWCLTYPTGEVFPQDDSGYGKVITTFRLPHCAKSEIMKKAIENNLELIRTYVCWSKIEIEEYNDSLRMLVEKAVNSRMELLTNRAY